MLLQQLLVGSRPKSARRQLLAAVVQQAQRAARAALSPSGRKGLEGKAAAPREVRGGTHLSCAGFVFFAAGSGLRNICSSGCWTGWIRCRPSRDLCSSPQQGSHKY
jgi:hypothetical protein